MPLLNKLHSLIQVMDTAEKRHFRLDLSALKKQQGQLTRFYDLLKDASPEQVSAEGFLGSYPKIRKNLPTLTRRLLDMVTTSLEFQSRGKTMESRLNHALETIGILYRKKQWDLANWKLRQEKRNALKYGYYLQFISLLRLERTILLDQFPNKSIDQLIRIREKEEEVQLILAQQSELSHLNDLARSLNRQRFRAKGAERIDSLKEIVAKPIVATGLSSYDFLSFSYATSIKGFYLNSIQDYRGAIEVSRMAFLKWKNDPSWIKEHPKLFLILFSSYQIALLHGQSDVRELEEALLFIRTVNIAAPSIQLVLQNLSYQGGIMLYMNRGDFETARTLSNEISKWLEENDKNLSRSVHLTFYYNAAAISLILEDFSGMRPVLYKMMDYSGKSIRQDITEIARLLNVVVSLESGDPQYAEDLLRNAYQYFLRHRYTSFYRITVLFLRQLLTGEKEKKQVYSEYLQDLERLLNESGKSDFGLMEFRIWAMARHRGISLREVFSEMLA